MHGGLLKSASRYAILAAAGLLAVGVSKPAKAADLGGDCCADLEERVAELEATTVRKSKRNITITVSGQVANEMLWWDDGAARRLDVGELNTTPSRIRFAGEAKVTPTLTAGYAIEFGFGTEAGTRRWDQTNAMRGQNERIVYGPTGVNPTGTDGLFFMRANYVYLNDKNLGQLRVGHTNSVSGEVFGIDLSGASGLSAPEQYELQGGGLFMRRSDVPGNNGLIITPTVSNGTTTYNSASTIRWANVLGDTQQARDGWRSNQIRYETPTFMGLSVSGSYTAENLLDVGAKFANEWNGLRVAAGISYAIDKDEAAGLASSDTGTCASSVATQAAVNCLTQNLLPSPSGSVDNRYMMGGVSAWHVPTGLFVSYNLFQKQWKGTATNVTNQAGQSVNRPDASNWQLIAGIKKNFFGLGATNFYGEYGFSQGWLQGQAKDFDGLSGGATYKFTAVTDDHAKIWGLGVIQTIDSANMDIFLAYRHYSAAVAGITAAGSATEVAAPLNDASLIMSGARIQF